MRELDRWAEENAALDLEQLRSGYHSAEIWFERWPRPWPAPVWREVVRRLVQVHDLWAARLASLGEPHYLGIWIFQPGLIESQVVAAVGERADAYRARHGSEHTAPPSLWDGVDHLEWTRSRWVRRELLSEFAPADQPAMLRAAQRTGPMDGDTALFFDHDDWYARLR